MHSMKLSRKQRKPLLHRKRKQRKLQRKPRYTSSCDIAAFGKHTLPDDRSVQAAEEAERARQARIDQEYISSEPMDIEAQVERIVVEQLQQMRKEVSEEYMAEISKLKQDIHNLRHNQ